MVEPTQQSQQQSTSNSGSNNDGCESDPEVPPARLHFKDKLRPGPLPTVTSPPKLPEGLAYVITESDKRRVIGVKTDAELEKGTELGIFNGSLVDEATGCVEESSWEVSINVVRDVTVQIFFALHKTPFSDF